jgi:hypothetical protein
MISEHLSTSKYDNVIHIHLCGSFRMFPENFVSKNYKTVQSCELHFLQNSPLVELCTSARDYKKCCEHLWKQTVTEFSALPSHS